jgi:hypothetical protein
MPTGSRPLKSMATVRAVGEGARASGSKPARGNVFALATVIVATLVTTSGCAPAGNTWVKPGTTLAQYDADRDDCLARTDRYLATGDRHPDFAALNGCMRQKGYTAVPNP